MKQSIRTGISFGITSGIITTLGLMVGLTSGTGSEMVVIGGILTIAVADAFSDALGIHLSEESKKNNNDSMVRKSTIATFFSKLIFALTFIIPIVVFPLKTGVIINIGRGFLAIILLTYRIIKNKGGNMVHAILEHLSITIGVIIITYYIGRGIAHVFGT